MLAHYLKVAAIIAWAEIRGELAGQWFGLAWWILEPLLYMGAFYVVFAVLGIRGGVDAAPFLLVGLVVWKWFSTSVATGSVALRRAAGIIQQVYVPKYVFVLVAMLTNFLRFLVVFLLLCAFLSVLGYVPGKAWLALAPVILVQGMLTFGVAGLFAALIPFVPDLRIVVNNGLTLMFFLSGVFFDVASAPEKLVPWLNLNPMLMLIDAYRDVMLEGVWPAWERLAWHGAGALAVVLLACYLLHRFDRVYPKVL